MGVARWPVRDCGHRTTSDMWLYRAYSGNLYHDGELKHALSRYTVGDTITAMLDMDARTLSFAKNDQVSHLATALLTLMENTFCMNLSIPLSKGN